MTDINATLSQTVITATVTNPAGVSASLVESPITATVDDGDVISGTVSSQPIAATLVNGGTITATVTEVPISASLVSYDGISEAPIDGTTYGRKDGGWTAAGGGSITVKEIDGSPSDTAVTVIQVPNGGLTDNGAGDVTLDYSVSGHTHAQLHDPATVSDTASINMSITGQAISADAIFGTSSTTIAAGNHLHSGTYEPADATIVKTGNASWIDLTDGGATTLHSHAGGSGDISGTGVVGQVAEFVTDTKTIQAAKLIAPANLLTLVAGAPYTLTVPATGIVALLGTANVFTALQTIKLANPALVHQVIGDVAGLHTKLFTSQTAKEVPAYANAGGMGDRTASITVASDLSWTAALSLLVNGVTTGTEQYITPRTQAVAGKYIRFQFTEQKIITEVKTYQDTTATHGSWQWQGSNDGLNWTNVGSPFTMGGANGANIDTAMSANTTGYVFYQLLGISGNTNTGSWPDFLEFEFKIGKANDIATIWQSYNNATTEGIISINPNGIVELPTLTKYGSYFVTFPASGTAGILSNPQTWTANQKIVGLNVQRSTGAFGSASISTALVMGDTVLGETIGAGMFVARLSPLNRVSTAFMSYDYGTRIQMDFGGGGWQGVDPTDMKFYTSPTYETTTIDTGLMRLHIKTDGQILAGESYSGNWAQFTIFSQSNLETIALIAHSTQTKPILVAYDNKTTYNILSSISSNGVGLFNPRTTTTNAAIEAMKLQATVSTAATGGSVGFGVGLSLYAETATDGTHQQQALISGVWVDATNATRKAKLQLSAYDTAQRLGITVEADGSQALTKIGDNSTNYLQIDGTGDLLLVGTAKYERHVQIPATPSGTIASQMDVDTLGTAVGLKASSVTDQYAGCQWEVPDDWDGTDCYIEIDWAPFSGAMSGTDTVEWIIEYRSIAEGEALTLGTVATMTATVSDDLAQGQTKHSRMTMTYNHANQPLTKQDHVYFLVHRNTGVAADFAGTALITAYEIIYTSNGFPASN